MTKNIDIEELTSEDFPIDYQKIDPYAKKLFKQIFTGMSGRYTRLKIIKSLIDEPVNVNQLSQKLHYDYKTIRRNVTILEKYQLIEKTGEGYGEIFFVSDLLLKNLSALDAVLKKVNIKLNKNKKYY